MADSARLPPEDKDRFYIRMIEGDMQDPFTHHSRRAKNDRLDLHSAPFDCPGLRYGEIIDFQVIRERLVACGVFLLAAE